MTDRHRPPSASRELTKITFELERAAWHGQATETLWGEEVGSGRYRLLNSPFFATGVSFMDVVRATPSDIGLMFAGASIRGGHSIS